MIGGLTALLTASLLYPLVSLGFQSRRTVQPPRILRAYELPTDTLALSRPVRLKDALLYILERNDVVSYAIPGYLFKSHGALVVECPGERSWRAELKHVLRAGNLSRSRLTYRVDRDIYQFSVVSEEGQQPANEYAPAPKPRAERRVNLLGSYWLPDAVSSALEQSDADFVLSLPPTLDGTLNLDITDEPLLVTLKELLGVAGDRRNPRVSQAGRVYAVRMDEPQPSELRRRESSITMVARDAPLGDCMDGLFKAAGVSYSLADRKILPTRWLAASMTVHLRGVPFIAALEAILRCSYPYTPMTYRIRDGRYEILPKVID